MTEIYDDITSVTPPTATEFPCPPIFVHGDQRAWALALERIRRNSCAYCSIGDQQCDCKWGLDLDSPSPWTTSSERTGCPELRVVINWLIAASLPGEDATETLFHQRDEAIAEREVLRVRAEALAAENARLRERMARAIELHTDSPAGVCPSCARIGEQSIDDDGLVPWPCPTVLALNPRAGVS